MNLKLVNELLVVGENLESIKTPFMCRIITESPSIPEKALVTATTEDFIVYKLIETDQTGYERVSEGIESCSNKRHIRILPFRETEIETEDKEIEDYSKQMYTSGFGMGYIVSLFVKQIRNPEKNNPIGRLILKHK